MNTLFAIVDTIIALVAVAAFSGAAYLFDKWWIVLFNIVPLLLFNTHTLVIHSDIIDVESEDETDG